MNMILNIAIYQTIWFLCVLGGNRGAAISFIFLLLHLLLTPTFRNDLKMMIILLIMGLMIDTPLQLIGFFSFSGHSLPVPLWLATIWLALATLVNHSLAWLKNRSLLSALFGALGGPLAYWAGVRLGAATFNFPLLPSLAILAIVWALLWPTIMYISKRLYPELSR